MGISPVESQPGGSLPGVGGGVIPYGHCPQVVVWGHCL